MKTTRSAIFYVHDDPPVSQVKDYDQIHVWLPEKKGGDMKVCYLRVEGSPLSCEAALDAATPRPGETLLNSVELGSIHA